MNILGKTVMTAEVSAIIIRKDGTREDRGVLARYDRKWYSKALSWLRGVNRVAGLFAALVVNTGRAVITDCLVGGSGSEPKYVAWGTGAGTAGATDTTLFTESSEESRTAGTSSQQTTTTANDTYRVVATITVATSNKTITNVGLFDASSSGNLFFKANFTGLALNVGDGIQFTISAQVG